MIIGGPSPPPPGGGERDSNRGEGEPDGPPSTRVGAGEQRHCPAAIPGCCTRMGQAGMGRCRGLTFFGPAPVELGLSSSVACSLVDRMVDAPDG